MKDQINIIREALENSSDLIFKDVTKSHLRAQALAALSELEAMAKEPAAWGLIDKGETRARGVSTWDKSREAEWTPLYAAPVAQQPQNDAVPLCVECSDQITAHDPGVCGTCFATKYEGAPQQDEAVPGDVVRDAERYRYLRSHCLCAGHGSITVFLDDRHGTGNRAKPLHLEEMDVAIDAAIAATKK